MFLEGTVQGLPIVSVNGYHHTFEAVPKITGKGDVIQNLWHVIKQRYISGKQNEETNQYGTKEHAILKQ